MKIKKLQPLSVLCTGCWVNEDYCKCYKKGWDD